MAYNVATRARQRAQFRVYRSDLHAFLLARKVEAGHKVAPRRYHRRETDGLIEFV